MEDEDLELMREMLNEPEIENSVVGWAFPVSKYQQQKWYENNINNNTNLRFIIETPENGAVGLATLTNIDWKNRSANHGIKLAAKNNRGKGVGTDTVMAVMKYAFEELNLHRLNGSWLEKNIGSEKLYTKCGWVIEGKKRQSVYKNGEFHNLVQVGILKSEYESIVKQLKYWE
ncbi:GNAT family N-acetyltransferase [Jeotgalibaca arthritidis]|uniref:GNAT family N-acetyltransferase n=1 Tax=Jeotgalibaca arthritidis TaxID=1868794 RepID=A0A6G7KD55_9LACT|nr:GNAT family N-acetyltransferase [Jeotgalibaca arthritidis]